MAETLADNDRSASHAVAPPPFVAAARAFASGHASPSAYLEACIVRIGAAEAEVGAFVALDLDAARAAAARSGARHRAGRPLSRIDGMPIGVKDIIETADFPTGMGSGMFAGWHARRDAACVDALRAAGAIVVGKTATTEFAVGRAAATRNPHDLARTPAGSSSGSAAAVAAGMLPLALGSQTQSSTLRPAAFCGVTGFKPTHGLLDLRGVHPLAPSHDHLGLIGASLEDLWATTEALRGRAGSFPPARQLRRLGLVQTSGWSALDAGAAATFGAFLARLTEAGITIATRATDASLEALERELADADAVSEDILAWEMQWPFTGYARQHPELLGERLHELLARGRHLGVAGYRQRLRRRAAMRAHARRAARGVDAFISLAASGVAPPGLANTGARSFPIPWSLVGGPSMSLPLLQHQGLPLGVQLMAAPHADRSLFCLARALVAPR